MDILPDAGLSVESLKRDQVRTVYPLIHVADPSISLPDWLRYAGRLASVRQARRGILVARRAAHTHPSGAVCYRCQSQIGPYGFLTAEHMMALDLLYPGTIVSALVSELDRIAVSLNCDRIRFIVNDAARPLFDSLRLAAPLEEGVMLTRMLTQPSHPGGQVATLTGRSGKASSWRARHSGPT